MVLRGSTVDNAARRSAIFTEDRHVGTPRGSQARVRSANRVAGEQHKVRSDHRAPRVGAKRLIGAPCATIPTEAPLEKRDDAFDARAEVPQALVKPRAPDHLLDRQPRRLAERDVSNAERFDLLQVVARAEASIEDDLL